MILMQCTNTHFNQGLVPAGRVSRFSVTNGSMKHWKPLHGQINIQPPPRFSSQVTLLGDGPSLYEAIENPDMVKGKIAAVNRSATRWNHHVDIWFTLHSDYMAKWIHQRKGPKVNCIVLANAVKNPSGAFYLPDNRRGGSSGLYALESLITMGFTEIFLVGFDLNNDPRPNRGDYSKYIPIWKDFNPKGVKIKVLTGNKEIFK